MLNISIVWHVEPFTRYGEVPVFEDENVSAMFDVVSDYSNVTHTFLLQSDYSVLAATGAYDTVFSRWESYWREQVDAGNEVGWHFHPVTKRGDCWHQVRSLGDVKDHLFRSYESISMHGAIKTASTGWCFGSSELTAEYVRLGISADVSCLPGLKSEGRCVRDRYGMLGTVDIFDWIGAPDAPYFPSEKDYRVASGVPCAIVELPSLTSDSRVVSLNEHPAWYRARYKWLAEEISSRRFGNISLYTHSYNMRSAMSRSHFGKHIGILDEICALSGVEPRYSTVSSNVAAWRLSPYVERIPKEHKSNSVGRELGMRIFSKLRVL